MNEDDRLEQAKAAVREFLHSVKGNFEPGVIDSIDIARHRMSVMTGVENPDRPPWREGMTFEEMAEACRQYPDTLAYDDAKAAPLIRKAAADANAFAALAGIAAEFVTRGEALPTRLGRFAMDYLGIHAPAGKPGQNRKQPRDVLIAAAVDIACQYGLKPTRGRKNKSNEPSASVIVAEVLAEMNKVIAPRTVESLAAGTVEGIWNVHKHLATNSPGESEPS